MLRERKQDETKTMPVFIFSAQLKKDLMKYRELTWTACFACGKLEGSERWCVSRLVVPIGKTQIGRSLGCEEQDLSHHEFVPFYFNAEVAETSVSRKYICVVSCAHLSIDHVWFVLFVWYCCFPKICLSEKNSRWQLRKSHGYLLYLWYPDILTTKIELRT